MYLSILFCIFINTYTLHHMCIEYSREWHNGSSCRPHRIKSCFTHRCFKLYTFMHSSHDNDIELSVKRFCIENFTFKIRRKRKNEYCVHRIFLRRHINIHSYSFEVCEHKCEFIDIYVCLNNNQWYYCAVINRMPYEWKKIKNDEKRKRYEWHGIFNSFYHSHSLVDSTYFIGGKHHIAFLTHCQVPNIS